LCSTIPVLVLLFGFAGIQFPDLNLRESIQHSGQHVISNVSNKLRHRPEPLPAIGTAGDNDALPALRD
jgi:hypothetical protein